jgi:hypothetical protein
VVGQTLLRSLGSHYQRSIELTKEQQDKIREATGQDAEAIELNAEELEDRISPWGPRMTM